MSFLSSIIRGVLSLFFFIIILLYLSTLYWENNELNTQFKSGKVPDVIPDGK
jgi:hypothetical protein